MSVRVLTKVFAHSEATLAARLVLLVLADAAHDDGITWVGQELIAAKALVSEQTVRRVLRDLETDGSIQMRKAQRGRRRINVYRLVLPGLLDPDYDRLPFTLEHPFTTAHPERSPEIDDRASCAPTAEDPDRDEAARPYMGEPSVEPSTPIAPLEGEPPWPGKVDRKPVTIREGELATAVLIEFNRVSGRRYSSKGALSKIIMRIREHPDVTLAGHTAVIEHSFRHPWWSGEASPSVIYGNDALFERSLNAAAAAVAGAPGGRLTREEMDTYMVEWGPGTPYDSLDQARAAAAASAERRRLEAS